jgi:hypothetical protein
MKFTKGQKARISALIEAKQILAAQRLLLTFCEVQAR